MEQLITFAPAKTGATEPVADAIRKHESATSDWAFHQIAARLNNLCESGANQGQPCESGSSLNRAKRNP